MKEGKRRQDVEMKERRRVARLTLDPDERVVDQSLRVVRVGSLSSRSSLGDIDGVLNGVESGVEVSRVDDEDVSSDLPKSERGNHSRLEDDMLDRLRGEEEVRVLPELRRDVVGVPVGRDQRRLERLEETVYLPGSL